MFPLSFCEFCSAYSGDLDEAWDDYCVYGGLPLILSRRSAEEKAGYLTALFQKVYLSDIVDRHKVRNREELEEHIARAAEIAGRCGMDEEAFAELAKTVYRRQKNVEDR